MLIQDEKSNSVYCDFCCKLCQCYRDQPCLLMGASPMRQLRAELMASKRIIRDGDFIGLWAAAKVLELSGSVVPPIYNLETCH